MLIEEVAKLSGVSRSTVSRVINNDPNVKESTRAHVLEVIRRVNYQPNSIARGLASGRTRIIGLVLPTAQSSLFKGQFTFATFATSLSFDTPMIWIAFGERSVTVGASASGSLRLSCSLSQFSTCCSRYPPTASFSLAAASPQPCSRSGTTGSPERPPQDPRPNR